MAKEQNLRQEMDQSLTSWHEKEKKAIDLIRIVGELRFDKEVELVIFRRDIYDCRPSEVLNHHTFSKNYIDQPIQIEDTLAIAEIINNIRNILPSRIDIGKLAAEKQQEKPKSLVKFIEKKLKDLTSKKQGNNIESKDVVLYGFGRIGRLVARRLISQTGKGEQLRLRAIVIRPQMKDHFQEAQKRAATLISDSVHGEFRGTVEVAPDGSYLTINGNKIRLIYASKPEEIDYTQYGIKDALVIDNTGVWREKATLSQHLRPGSTQVMLTAPGKDIPNFVYGANHNDYNVSTDAVFCAASCTTNAVVPVIKVIDDAFGIERGHIETIHAFTNDQNLLDNFHKKPRRGKAAPLNMVLTTTEAAKAVAKVLPHLTGKLTANAVRVPVPNVSIAIMNLSLKKTVTPEQINDAVRQGALHGDFVEQIQYSTSEEY
ncbi:MAG: glyceraldehyde-3-phosphate dehydrogenase, partial [Saprospiraceae bacterium]